MAFRIFLPLSQLFSSSGFLTPCPACHPDSAPVSTKIPIDGKAAHGIQLFVNLPSGMKLTKPTVQLMPRAALPVFTQAGVRPSGRRGGS